MNDLIGRIAAWARRLRTTSARRLNRRTADLPAPLQRAPRTAPTLPTPRSPYGLDAPLDGHATALVRPYLLAAEQRQRRRALALATLGLDFPGAVFVHGVEVA